MFLLVRLFRGSMDGNLPRWYATVSFLIRMERRLPRDLYVTYLDPVS